MNQLNHKKKIFLLFAITVISCISLITAVYLYNHIESILIEEKGKEAMSVSVTVAKLLEQDYSSFLALVQTENYREGNYNKVYYDSTQQIFRELKNKTNVKFLYCGKRISENEMVYLFDGEVPDCEQFSPLGSLDDLDEVEQKIYKEKKSSYTPIVNDPVWGELLTGVTPIIDPSTGEVIAHVGVDVSVAQIKATLTSIRNIIFFNSIIVTIITSVIIYRLLSMALVFTENDYLTGLYSKAYQDRFLEQLIRKSTSSEKPFSLIMLDFDGFKHINDQYGHQFGDIVLKAVSEIIKSSTRSIDCCSRYGGDEFVIILPEANLGYAVLLCEWLLKEVSGLKLSTKDGEVVPVSISIGVSEWASKMSSDQVLIRADKALYRSKRTGKNKLTVYTDALD